MFVVNTTPARNIVNPTNDVLDLTSVVSVHMGAGAACADAKTVSVMANFAGRGDAIVDIG